MSDDNKLRDASELDWTAVKEAAQRIIRRCDDAGFAAPENLLTIRANIECVCRELDAIVKALKITPPGGRR